MKKGLILGVLYLFILILILPPAGVFIGSKIKKVKEEKKELFETVKVYITSEDKVCEMNTSQYLKEVVGAEMPATFSYEALKAQAVAARTYLCAKMDENHEAHKGGVVCTDYKHCKAWLSESERKAAWEEDKREEYWQRVSGAVEETAGEIIKYKGEPISAVFHSTSSGKTENSADVWGKDVPYLRSVESKGDELSPKFLSEFSCTVQEFCDTVSSKVDNTDWNCGLFSNIVRSQAGGIIKITLGGVEVKGTTFREIFALRSTNVDIEQTDDKIIMKVKGNGHGVGMSQYGANFMGNNGSSYKEILTYYYRGTTIG